VVDVLVVDDDPSLRLLLEVHLRAAGHRVRQAETVEQALLQTAMRRPDVLLLDVHLAGQRGEALIELLDRGLGRPHGVVLVSGIPPEELEVLAACNGVRHLPKPFDPRTLLEVVEAAAHDRRPDADGDGGAGGGRARPGAGGTGTPER
jgi:DNA-binding response OmpR family regulator